MAWASDFGRRDQTKGTQIFLGPDTRMQRFLDVDVRGEKSVFSPDDVADHITSLLMDEIQKHISKKH